MLKLSVILYFLEKFRKGEDLIVLVCICV